MTKSSSNPAPRGRPREFDVDAAIEKAMHVFWSMGYQGTSLPDLLEATNLSRGSLYAAFGDKHGVFLLALDRYIDQSIARLGAELSAARDPVEGLRTCVAGYVDRTVGVAGQRGCLVVATAMELAAHDVEAQRRIRRFFDKMETLLVATLSRAREQGALVEGVEPETVARLLLCFLEGVRVVGKVAPKRATSHAVAQAIIDRFMI